MTMPYKQSVRDEAVKLYQEGLTLKQTAARFGCSFSIVRYWLDAAGIPRQGLRPVGPPERRGYRPRHRCPQCHSTALHERIPEGQLP